MKNQAKSHRESYPEQYEHPLCGKRVRCPIDGTNFTVERVVKTRFGLLAPVPGTDKAYALTDLEEVTPEVEQRTVRNYADSIGDLYFFVKANGRPVADGTSVKALELYAVESWLEA